jgi:hypothetical protein
MRRLLLKIIAVVGLLAILALAYCGCTVQLAPVNQAAGATQPVTPAIVHVDLQPGAIAIAATLACSRPLVDVEPKAVELSFPVQVGPTTRALVQVGADAAPTTQSVAAHESDVKWIIGGMVAICLVVLACRCVPRKLRYGRCQ